MTKVALKECSMQISAQISLYPLRQERLSPTIEEAWQIFEGKHEDLASLRSSSRRRPGLQSVFGSGSIRRLKE